MIILFIVGLGLVFSGIGAWMWKKPPRRINRLAGYRSPRSMKSQAAWDFAQVYSGRLMCISGLVMMLVVTPLFWFSGYNFDTLNPALIVLLPLFPVLAATIIPIYFTERKLKSLFDNEGNPKK
ncbi:SdpI family protein [Chitinophaga barathri]|uniref:SdpI family protein n=1 Tax=Chitinophaga barathri TaxID=1647451 RepID=A0A3N4MGE8_9BACT|nr:SdpI family protein [Chitinophaga barathri]RPD38729.1 SdpI family protein [Chitinophaga barathri]